LQPAPPGLTQNMRGSFIMPKATQTHTTSRRSALRGISLAAITAGLVPTLSHAASASDDELIRVCQDFAEREFDQFYHYAITENDDDYPPPDWGTYHRIIETQATTPAGWHAKALAYAAWDKDAYDDTEPDLSCSTFIASLLRDMVAPARDAIIAKLAMKYGPLPSEYTVNAMWIGYSGEKKAQIDAANERRAAERLAIEGRLA
jgi:hypothetical protein